MSYPKTLKKCDTLFREIFWLKYEGVKHCYTCGAYRNDLQLGHYISRTHKHIRFNLDNVRPQGEHCCNCDQMRKGQVTPIFREKLIEEIGLDRVLELEQLKHKSDPFDVYEEYDNLKSRLKQLKVAITV